MRLRPKEVCPIHKSVSCCGREFFPKPKPIRLGVQRIAKGLVSRVESTEDRRVRIVALTPRGNELIASAFRKHSGQMKRVFSELSPEELRGLEVKLKEVGKRAAALMEES
jgi:MarR family transcriptional regulator, 2-MHQ and catechol-resistance regulon repressor